ncbi:DNA ligase-like protein I [Tothia fuscella]|uniref:DNA ligase n=1 Tax=Tothia fuscella TaxID=1048955 RepID=A0A9P4NZD2_9PEZI|nr:DNA ligase-like protein I [Tothia fuscella]
MSSPAKRRKTNNDESSNKPVRGLDYFFAKQKDAAKAKIDSAPPIADQGELPNTEETGSEALTDEQFARKLQEEWDQQSRSSVPKSPAKEISNHEPLKEDPPAETKTEEVPKGPGKSQAQNHPAQTLPFNSKGQKTLSLQSTATDEDMITLNIPFDESPLTFKPSDYIPELQKHWTSDGGRASYALLTRCFVLVNATASRIKIVDTLVNLLRTLIEGDPDSLLPAVWLATNSISPPYIDLELGLGGSAISKALKKVCGLDNAGLKALHNKHGDAGDVAFEAKKRQSFTLRKPKPLSIKGVFDSLEKIARSKGQGSQEVKQRIVERLVQDSRGAEESRYIVRTLVQHLRIGAVKTTMLIALSRAFLLSRPPNATFPTRSQVDLAKLKKDELTEVWHRGEETVKASFARRPNYNDLVPTLLEIGVCDELLLRCGLALHIPLRPMLGSITRDLGEMLTKLQIRTFSCEYKYDGQRAQVHCDEQGKVTIFSRHLELMTDKYPDLVELVPKIRGEGVSSFILEGEVVAVDKESGDLKAFQTLSNRARKDVVIQSVKIDVCLFAFDLMYLNGEELLDRPFRERRSLLRSLFVELPNHFTWVKNIDATSADSEAILEFFKSATDIKCEGIMVKVLDNAEESTEQDEVLLPQGPIPTTPQKTKKTAKSKAKTKQEDATAEKDKGGRRKALLATYEPDKRLESWLKVKKDYNTSADTLDLIPIAGWHGMGRKSKWWSPILLAVRNPTTGTLVAVTKCISGFTDAFYIANRAKYDPDTGNNVIARPGYVDYNGNPDVWFEPQEVWEMAFADITLSPTYTAAIGLVSEERGLSMRFPRFLKVREDKGLEEASSEEFLADLWWKQEERVPSAAQAGGEKDIDAEDLE